MSVDNLCDIGELPATITKFLKDVYARYPKPKAPEVLPPVKAKPGDAHPLAGG